MTEHQPQLQGKTPLRVTDSSSCGKCGAAGRGVYYSGEKVGRECINCGLMWVHLRGIVHPGEGSKR